MTREEAIKLFRKDIECLSHDKCSDCILEEACDPMKTPPDSEYIEAYGMAIEALSAEPCEDAISRQAVLEAIMTNCIWENEYNLTSSRIKKAVESLPPVTPKPKTGHWIKDNPWTKAYCSECGESCFGLHGFDCVTTDYCPNCGAKMEESE